jgi:hypothetical protein
MIAEVRGSGVVGFEVLRCCRGWWQRSSTTGFTAPVVRNILVCVQCALFGTDFGYWTRREVGSVIPFVKCRECFTTYHRI